MHADMFVDDELHARQSDAACGCMAVRNAISGVPTLTMMAVRRLLEFADGRACDVESDRSLIDIAGVTFGAGDRDSGPRFQFLCRMCRPTTAGIPSSRATMAAWHVRPPLSVMTPAATFMTGSQSGLVAVLPESRLA